MSKCAPFHFDGETYDEQRDHERLTAQKDRVFEVMKDGRWRTLGDVERATHAPQASISARLRDLRKGRFGAHTVERKYAGGGLYMYRLVVNEPRKAA